MKTARPPLSPRLVVLVLSTLALAGCGPKREDIGAAALMTVAFGNLFVAILMVPLITMWRALRPQLQTRWLAFVLVAILQLAVAWHFGRNADGQLRATADLVLLGACAVMPGYAGLSLIVFRVLWARGWAWGHALAPALACLPIVIPAVLMTQHSKAVDDFAMAWLLAGGLLPIALAVLLIETAVRQRRARRTPSVREETGSSMEQRQ